MKKRGRVVKPLTGTSRSVRARLLAESMGALLVVLCIGVVTFAVSLDGILAVVAREDAEGQVREVAGLLESGRLTPDRTSEEVAGHGSVIQVVGPDGRIVGASGTPLASSPFADLRPGPGQQDSVRIHRPAAKGDEHWVVVARGARPPGAVGTSVVLVAEPLRAPDAILSATVWRLIAATLVVLAIVALLLERSISATLTPVERITNEVDRIQSARTAGRVTEPGTADEIDRLAQVMNRMLERLDRADSVTRTFISNASHELRSPLATIRVSLEGQPGDPAAPTADRDRIIHTEVLRMQRLVDDLLTIARADDARLDLAKDEVDLDDVVDVEVRRLRAVSTHTVQAHIDGARVTGDQGRLQQVVRNLCDNANRHARSRVEVTLRVEGVDAVIDVDNDGGAIPQEEREVVFGRFVRVGSDAGSGESLGTPFVSGGSGLGLPIARMIAEAHDGTVRVVDAPAGVCRFEVRLPLAEV